MLCMKFFKINRINKEKSPVNITDSASIKKTDSVKEFIAKLSRGLMLPIAMLPIAGLFLGIGATIVSKTQDGTIWRILGQILKVPGDAIFANLPVLFCIAVAITFSNDIGTAGLSAFIGWITFCAFQSALIMTANDGGYNFLWYHYNKTEFDAIFGKNVGITSLQTSVFGGIIVGYVVSILYNKFKNIQLPQAISFFSGARFIPIIVFISMIFISLIFSVIWPLFGLGLIYFGKSIGQAPLGINSFIFGYTERSLVPLGLHHAFYAPLWYTSAGGTIDLTQKICIDGKELSCTWIEWLGPQYVGDKIIGGDQNCWIFANAHLVGRTIEGKLITFDLIEENFKGVNPGQYMQGKYPFMMLGLPFAGLAMIMSAPKGEQRKLAFGAIIGAVITTFLTGITEPIEFTFLFLAPWLYYGFHAVLCAISFWLMNVFHAHVGMSFSAGVLDFLIYGVLPDIAGAGAKCWIAICIGLCLSPIYFFGFLFFIKKFNISTPGRNDTVRLFNKKDYQLLKLKKTVKTTESVNEKNNKIDEIIKAYGGKENIVNVDACITKLRIQVVSQSKVNEKKLIELGAKGVIKPSKQLVYAVFGTSADIIKNQMKEKLNDQH